jgi:choline kinase
VPEICDVKAIILAAGRGARLGRLTRRQPKGVAIVINGTPILQMQLDVLRACGIGDIAIVRGYRARTIRFGGVAYFENPRYARTNLLESLMCAEAALNGETIVSYSDIWYEASVLRGLLRCRQDIAIVVDLAWRRQYVGRTEHPFDEADQAVLGRRRIVRRVGKLALPPGQVSGEFTGLTRLSRRGCVLLRRHYHRAKARYARKPFHTARRFERAYLTDLLQEMIDSGVTVHAECVRGGWGEIDTEQDYLRAVRRFRAQPTPAQRLQARKPS